MAKITETKAPAAETIPPVQPAPQLPAKSKRLESWETFNAELAARADEIGSQLPPNVTRERFMGAALAAVKATPEILTASPRSLFAALTKAAQDGLLPDGREGIITVYSQKIKGSNPERYENVAQWNPMFYGIRKRARELDGIIIDAQVVIDGDEFDYELGDAPFIKHKPKARAAKIEAQHGVAVYAIFRADDGRILHREVMWKHDVFDVMNQSKAKTSLMWTTFWTEGWRKTCGRRGSKSVPMSPKLQQVIQRDDENFSFDRDPPPAAAITNSLPEFEEPPIPVSSGGPAAPDAPPASGAAPTPADQAGDFNDDDSGVSIERTPDELLEDIEGWFVRAKTEADIEETWSELDVESEFAHDAERMGKAIDLKTMHIARVNNLKPAEPSDEDRDAMIDSLFPGARGS